MSMILEGTGSMIIDRPNKLIYACISGRTNLELLEKFASTYTEGNFKAPLRSLKRIICHALGIKQKKNAA